MSASDARDSWQGILTQISVRLSNEDIEALDSWVDEGAFVSRSSAVRVAVRELVAAEDGEFDEERG